MCVSGSGGRDIGSVGSGPPKWVSLIALMASSVVRMQPSVGWSGPARFALPE